MRTAIAKKPLMNWPLCSANVQNQKKAAKAVESEQERKDKRETTLEDARADIDDLFGDSADERGEQSLPEDERDLLFEAAKLVYDQAWRSVVVKVTQGFSLKISVTDKGKLTIQRDDSTTRKREHK